MSVGRIWRLRCAKASRTAASTGWLFLFILPRSIAPCIVAMQKSAIWSSSASLESRPFAFSLMKNAASLFFVFGNFVADCSERTATSHTESPLQRDVREEPLFQILPGLDLIFEGRGASSDRIQMTLKHFVHKAFF